jgi:hypothetical protein
VSRAGAVTRTIGMFAALAVLAACSKTPPAPLEATALASAAAPPSAAPAPAPAANAPSDALAAKAFGAPCVEDAQCAGGVCFHKRLKGPDAGKERRGGDDPVEHDGYCSLRCNDDADCPVPLTKGRCGARGMCKRPD